MHRLKAFASISARGNNAVFCVSCKIRQSRVTVKEIFEGIFLLFLSLKLYSIHCI